MTRGRPSVSDTHHRGGRRRLSLARRGGPVRYAPFAMIAVPVALFVAVACTTQTRHEWLDYFLDGVPPLNGGISRAPVMTAETVDAASPSLSSPRAKPAKPKYYNHPEYFANRCDGCHASEFGELRMTPREGLCSSCHPDKPPKKEFVHGPVAVNGCLACHRYHKSLYPKVLIADAQELCFHCHETDQMRTDEHHATIETERCIDCHDPHGGDDRFFLIKKPESVDST